LLDAASAGMPVLGICNGFQSACETHLLAGAMIKNTQLRFVCTDQVPRIENADTAWTHQYDRGEEITVPLKNQDGQFIADEPTLDELDGEGRVVLRYGGSPDGSRRAIAAITNARGNVVGLMPHPEHATEPGFGPSTDGLRFFTSALTAPLASA